MGMFDTFYIRDRGRLLDVQSKQFARVLNTYELGDFVTFDTETPHGVHAYIEDYCHDIIDPDCPLEWIVLLLVDGCFLDVFVAGREDEARHAAELMVKQWQSPERQAEAFQRHAHAHYNVRTEQQRTLDQVCLLLSDYAEWEQRKAQGEKADPRFAFLRHDFDQEGWDWAVARLLFSLPGYRERVPARYAVALELRARNNMDNHE